MHGWEGEAQGIRVGTEVRWFVLAAYAVTWIVVSPLVVAAVREGTAPPWLHALGATGPTIAAVAVTVRRSPGRLTGEVRRMFRWKGIDGRTWLWAITPIPFALFGIGVTALMSGLPSPSEMTGDPSVSDGAWVWMLVAPAIAFGVLEEPGWRGFLLPRLQASHTASGATWRLWLIWAGWHAPFFFYRYEPTALPAVVGTMYFGAVWLTGLTNSAGGSILPAILWHVLYDLSVIVPESMPAVYPVATSVPVVAAAIWMGRRFGGENLSDRPRVTVTRVPGAPESGGAGPE